MPELYSTDMTAIVATKYKDGILIVSDSLALDIKTRKEGDFDCLIVDKLTKQCQKIFHIAPYAVISYSGTAFNLGLMTSIANGLIDTIDEAKAGRFNTIRAITEQAAKAMKKSLNQGGEVRMMVAGYNLDADGEPTTTCMYYVDETFAIEEVIENHVGLGARKIIDEIITEENINLLPTDNFKITNTKLYSIFDYCKEEENKLVAKGTHVWQIGGGLKRYRITKSGVEELKNERYLPVTIKVGDVMSKEAL